MQKFIVVCRSRTGSSYLSSLLQSHPQIRMYREKFKRLNGRKTQDIWDEIYINRRKEIHAVGFKLFYYHPLDCEEKHVWNKVLDDRSIKIIHLTRNNLLTGTSVLAVARKTGVWTIHSKKSPPGSTIPLKHRKLHVDVGDLMNFFERTKRIQNKIRMRLRRHSLFELEYEHIESMTNDIQDFIGVDQSPLKSHIVRNNPEQLEELILNYQEIKHALLNTPHQIYLQT